MHNSETEEGSEEEEDEEEEDICEEEEEEEEEESEEEDVNGGGGGGGSDRVDLGVQTSLLDSPSPTVSSPSSHTQVSNKNIPKSRFLTCTYSEIPGTELRKYSHKWWSSIFIDTHLPHVLVSSTQNELQQFTWRGASDSALSPYSIQ